MGVSARCGLLQRLPSKAEGVAAPLHGAQLFRAEDADMHHRPRAVLISPISPSVTLSENPGR